MQVVIYHNPKCSKSRKALELLRSRNIEPRIIEYLKSPPSRMQLTEILSMLELTPRGLIRSSEPEYRDNGLANPEVTDDELLQAIVEYPVLMQRPIVLGNGKAAIGRPPEQVLKIL
jgi:arsenate reductase